MELRGISHSFLTDCSGQHRTQAHSLDIRRILTCGSGFRRTGWTDGLDDLINRSVPGHRRLGRGPGWRDDDRDVRHPAHHTGDLSGRAPSSPPVCGEKLRPGKITLTCAPGGTASRRTKSSAHRISRGPGHSTNSSGHDLAARGGSRSACWPSMTKCTARNVVGRSPLAYRSSAAIAGGSKSLH